MSILLIRFTSSSNNSVYTNNSVVLAINVYTNNAVILRGIKFILIEARIINI